MSPSWSLGRLIRSHFPPDFWVWLCSDPGRSSCCCINMPSSRPSPTPLFFPLLLPCLEHRLYPLCTCRSPRWAQLHPFIPVWDLPGPRALRCRLSSIPVCSWTLRPASALQQSIGRARTGIILWNSVVFSKTRCMTELSLSSELSLYLLYLKEKGN